MSTTRLRVDAAPTSRTLNLPEPFRDAAKLVVKKHEMIAAVLSRSPMVSAEQFLVAAIAEVNSMEMAAKSKIDPTSVVKAVFNCATLGLLFGPTRGHAYLVPFRKKNSPVSLVNLIVGYRGYIELAYRSSFLKTVDSEVILQDEVFKTYMMENGRKLHHELPISRNPSSSGENVIGSYCIFQTRHGGSGMAIVPRSEIESIRKDSDPWKFKYPAMARKTAILRAAKNWSLTEQLSAAILLDEQADRDEEQASLIHLAPENAKNLITVAADPILPGSSPDSDASINHADGDLLEYFNDDSNSVHSNQLLVRLFDERENMPRETFVKIVQDRLSMADPRCAVIKMLVAAHDSERLQNAASDLDSLRGSGVVGQDLYSAMKQFANVRASEFQA